jgi:chromosome segregation ATPase
MAPSQTESDRVADQLQLIAAYVRSLPGQPQLQQTQVQGVSKPHNELRDMKNRLRIIETQLQESKEESVEKLKDRIDSLEAQNGQLQTHNGQLQAFVESIANAVGVLQNDFVAAQAEITTWKA